MNLDHLMENAIAMGFDEDTIGPILTDANEKLHSQSAHNTQRNSELTHHLAVWIKPGQKEVYDQLAKQAKVEGVLQPHQKTQDYLRLWMHRLLIEFIQGKKIVDPRTAKIS